MATYQTPVHVTIFDRKGRRKITAYDDSMWGWPNKENVIEYVLDNPAKQYPDHVVEVVEGTLAWRFRTGRWGGQPSVRLLRKARSHSSSKVALHHATKKKSRAQLDREIAEVLGVKPISKRKAVRHFSHWTDKTGRTHYAVTYEDRSGHSITREELERHRGLGGLGVSSHATIKYDRDDAREFGLHAYRMEQTKAQTLANARAQGFAAHHLAAVEEGWEAERRDTIHGGFVSTSHATKRGAGVEVDTSAYRRTHGAEPRGSGNWKFVIGAREYAYGDESDLYRPAEARGAHKAGRPQLSFAKAKEYAIAEAKRRGATIVGVSP